MSNDPVNPAEAPVFTGDLATLDVKVKSISTGGATIATAAGDVHSSFGGLSAYYQAPEADQLFATTKPVSDLGLKLSGDICTIAGALGAYSRDAAPLVKRLEDLKNEAAAFQAKANSDHKWREDGGKVDENNNRRNEIADVWTQFQAVERTAYATIVALVGGKPLKVNDGSNGADMYGYDAKALKDSQHLPWGDAVDKSVPWWKVWDHAYDFGKGVIVDGVWGTIKGLGTLVGVNGWGAAGQAWTGLAKLATGLAITSIPGVGPLFLAVPDDKLPSWLRDSRTAMKETGKALLAWDEWGHNPSRAAGAVTFNVLTTIFTGGEAGGVEGAGKAGAVAKTLSVAGKVGKAIDPMTYVFKGAGFGISKVSDVMSGLKGISDVKIPKIDVDGAFALPEGAVHLPDGGIRLPAGTAIPEGAIRTADGGIKLPEGTVELPPGTVKLEVGGRTEFLDPHGNVYDHNGNILQHGTQAPHDGAGLPAGDHPPVKLDTPVKVRTPELVGVGARDGDKAIHLNSDLSHPHDIPRPGHAPDHTPGGHAPEGPRNDLNTPRPGHDTPTTTGHDTGSTGSHDTGSAGGHGHPTAGGHDGGSTGGHDAGSAGGHGHPTTGGHDTGSTGGHGGQPGPNSAERAAQHAEYEAAREKPADARTPAERAAITREHVRLANDDPAWRAEHYDKIGRRLDSLEKVDGQLLPKLTEKPGGGWMNADHMPYADAEKYHLETLERDQHTVHPNDIHHLDDVSARRKAGMELTAAEKAYKAHPTAEFAKALEDAQQHFDQTVGAGVSNNSKLGEALGEEAARRHMLLQPEFKGAKEVTDLPETANGSKRFDQLWRDKDGNLVIVEAKGPNARLDWRQGNGPQDSGTMVKQGSIEYVRTILADMRDRAAASPDDAKYAAEIRQAIKNKTLRYVLVQATENNGKYAGAELSYFKIF